MTAQPATPGSDSVRAQIAEPPAADSPTPGTEVLCPECGERLPLDRVCLCCTYRPAALSPVDTTEPPAEAQQDDERHEFCCGAGEQFVQEAYEALAAAGYRPATHDGIVTALLPVVLAYGDQKAAEDLVSFADWNDEQPNVRVSRGVVASVCRDRADRFRARTASLPSPTPQPVATTADEAMREMGLHRVDPGFGPR